MIRYSPVTDANIRHIRFKRVPLTVNVSSGTKTFRTFDATKATSAAASGRGGALPQESGWLAGRHQASAARAHTAPWRGTDATQAKGHGCCSAQHGRFGSSTVFSQIARGRNFTARLTPQGSLNSCTGHALRAYKLATCPSGHLPNCSPVVLSLHPGRSTVVSLLQP
jgi:hypothetical protein